MTPPRLTPEEMHEGSVSETFDGVRLACSCGQAWGASGKTPESIRDVQHEWTVHVANTFRTEVTLLRADLTHRVYPHLLEEHISELEGQLADANTLLAALVDDEPCAFFDTDYCQTHNLTKPCAVAQAREFLADYAPVSPVSVREAERAAHEHISEEV